MTEKASFDSGSCSLAETTIKKIKFTNTGVDLTISINGPRAGAGYDHTIIVSNETDHDHKYVVLKLFRGTVEWAEIILHLTGNVRYVEQHKSDSLTTDKEIEQLKMQLIYRCESLEAARNYGKCMMGNGDTTASMRAARDQGVYYIGYVNNLLCSFNSTQNKAIILDAYGTVKIVLPPGARREVPVSYATSLMIRTYPDRITRQYEISQDVEYLPIDQSGTVIMTPFASGDVLNWIRADLLSPIRMELDLVPDTDGAFISLKSGPNKFMYDLLTAKVHILPYMMRGHISGLFKYIISPIRRKFQCIPIIAIDTTHECELCDSDSDSDSDDSDSA